jgi:tetratricopeptide (TPR) repeat protein
VELTSRILAEHGPLDEDDVVARLRAHGMVDPEAAVDHALDEISCPAAQLVDDRWVWLPAVLSGRVFTHRVDAYEVAHDLLTATPDLSAIAELCHHEQYQRLADGSPVIIVLNDYDDDVLDQRDIPPEAVDEGGALLLAPGTLSAIGVTAGDLVGVRLTHSGLVVERVTAVGPGADLGDRLAATLATDEPTFLDAAVFTVCVADPAAFTEPVPPLGDIIADRGLVRDLDSVAPHGFDFEAWRFERRCDRLALRYDIGHDDALALHTLVTIYENMALLLALSTDIVEEQDDSPEPAGDGYQELVAAFGSALRDPHLAEAFMSETVGSGGHAAALGLFAETLEPQVPRSARVAYRWLRAVALEHMGDVEDAEREYLAAESMDTEWPSVLLDLARFAADRGDAERGLALLRRAGAPPDDPLAQVLEQYRTAPRTDVGRNDACWCGSGRKYKKCHLGREEMSLDDRARWLYVKACQHLSATAWSELADEVAEERAAHATSEEEAEALWSDPLVIDAVLFEGGAFEEWLARRGVLLPADERLLAEQWLLVERSVFEVEQVSPSHSITLRDVRTGDVHEVRERTASATLKPGQLICARVVPAGETYQIFGGLEPVALHDRDGLIELLDSEPDPVELVAFLSRRFAPPTLVNTEGDPLMICEATVRVGASTPIESALDDAFDRADGEVPQWLEHVTTHGMNRISAILGLDGNTLTIQTNSERRMDRVLATVRRLDPSMTLVSDERFPPSDIDDLARHAPSTAAGALDPNDPEIAAALDGYIRQYETAWLDESIPALDGYTPRQAADDPTRRADLIKLLDSFPTVVEGGTGMDKNRLRAALGLS